MEVDNWEVENCFAMEVENWENNQGVADTLNPEQRLQDSTKRMCCEGRIAGRSNKGTNCRAGQTDAGNVEFS